ncbi:S8 family serine peptidase [Nonomuraea ferruginea]
MVAARAAGTSMGTPTGDSYTSASGTSMATPHVAGAAAILAQRHPDWEAGQLKTALMSTAEDVGGTVYELGSGRLDLATAITQRIHATTPNLDYGHVEAGTAPISKEISYVNASDQPVTLTLTPDLANTADEAVPEGILAVDATLTIPAKPDGHGHRHDERGRSRRGRLHGCGHRDRRRRHPADHPRRPAPRAAEGPTHHPSPRP